MKTKDQKVSFDEMLKQVLEEDLRREIKELEAELANIPPYQFSREFHDRMFKVFFGDTALDYQDAAGTFLQSLGCKRTLVGFCRMRDVLSIVAANPEAASKITKHVIPIVAMKYDTSPKTFIRSLDRLVQNVPVESYPIFTQNFNCRVEEKIHLLAFIDYAAIHIRNQKMLRSPVN